MLVGLIFRKVVECLCPRSEVVFYQIEGITSRSHITYGNIEWLMSHLDGLLRRQSDLKCSDNDEGHSMLISTYGNQNDRGQ